MSLFTVHAVRADALPLQEALIQAVKTHPQIISKRFELTASGFLLDGAEWGRFPSLTTDVNTLESGDNNVTVRVEQPLWTGGRITGQINSAEASVQMAQASLGAIEQQILMETATAYFDLARMQAKLKIAQDNELEHQRLVESMARRVASEISPKADLTQAETRLQQASSDSIQLQNQARMGKIALEQLVGYEIDTLDTPYSLLLPLKNGDDVFEQARHISPERIRLEFEVKKADADIQLSKAQLMPNLLLGYQKRIGNVFFTPDNNQLYLGLRFNSGPGLSGLSGVNASIASRDAALNQIDIFDRTLMQETKGLWAERNGLMNQYEQVRSSVLSSEHVIQSYFRQFQVGKKNWLEVLNAQREKTMAYLAFTDVVYTLELTTLKMLILTGQLHANQMDLNLFFEGKRLYELDPAFPNVDLNEPAPEGAMEDMYVKEHLVSTQFTTELTEPSEFEIVDDSLQSKLQLPVQDSLELNLSRTLQIIK